MKLHFLLFFLLICGKYVQGGILPTALYFIQGYIESQLEQVQNKNTTCYKQIQDLLKGVQNFDIWALEMADAIAKPQSGLMMGNIIHVGNYDECLGVRGNSSENELIRGKYCNVKITPSQSLIDAGDQIILTNMIINLNGRDLGRLHELYKFSQMYYGLCIPDSCTSEILQDGWKDIKNATDASFELIFFEKYCAADSMPDTYNFVDYLAVFFFTTILILIIISTIYDYFIHQKIKKNDEELSVYICYSLYTNWKRLFSLKTMKDQIKCLNGIRVISLMWVLIGHRFLSSSITPNVNIKEIYEWRTELSSQFIIGASVSVDTFLMVTGLLIVYLFLMAMDMGVPFVLPLFYVHRLVRMWPALFAAVLFYAGIMEHMGSGPYWPGIYRIFKEQCETHGWTTLTFLNNYVQTTHNCIGQSWYIAVDMQLYFLSPLFLYPLVRWPKRALMGIVAVLWLSMTYSFILTWVTGMGAQYLELNMDYFPKLYEPTHVRMTPWLVGAICGYYLHVYKNRTILLSKKIVALGWILTMSLLLVIILGQVSFAYDYNVFRSASFAGFARPAWAVGLCWIIFACHHGYGGPVNWLLSLPIFTILVRLSYSIFLTHMGVIGYQTATRQSPDYLSRFQNFHRFWGDYVFTIVASIIFTLAFESPIILLEKVLLGTEEEFLEKAKAWGTWGTIFTKMDMFTIEKPKESIEKA